MAPNESNSNLLSGQATTDSLIPDKNDPDRIEDVESGSDLDPDILDQLRKMKLRRSSSDGAPHQSKFKCWIQLFVFAFAELIGGFTFSLLSPFYTKEATAKGLSVSQTGLVRWFPSINIVVIVHVVVIFVVVRVVFVIIVGVVSVVADVVLLLLVSFVDHLTCTDVCREGLFNPNF